MFHARRGSHDMTRGALLISRIITTLRSYRAFLFFIAVCIVLSSFATLQYVTFYHSTSLTVYSSAMPKTLLLKASTTRLSKPGVNQRTIKDLYRNREPSHAQQTQQKIKDTGDGVKQNNAIVKSDGKNKHVRGSDMKTEYPLTINRPYLMENPNLCSSVSNLKVLVIVHTAPGNFEKRASMRRTWTNSTYLHDLEGELRVLFLLGRVRDSTLQDKLNAEFRQYNDMVQGDFLDAYRNLSHKGVMGYKWIAEKCKNAQFVLKVDDDVIVNTYKLYHEFLPRFQNKNKQIFCNHIIPGTMLIIRKKKSKWYVDEKYFKGQKYYPRYCSGFMVLFTNDAIPAIYRSASITPFFWVDDVYLYGLVPSAVPGIKYNGLRKKRYELTGANAIKCYRNETRKCDYVVTGANKPEIVDEIWSFMIKQSSGIDSTDREILIEDMR